MVNNLKSKLTIKLNLDWYKMSSPELVSRDILIFLNLLTPYAKFFAHVTFPSGQNIPNFTN